MRRAIVTGSPLLAAALMAAFLSGPTPAAAGECGDGAHELEQQYGLAAVPSLDAGPVQPGTGRAVQPPGRSEVPRGAAPVPRADTASGDAGVDAVPNTGGVTTPRNSPPAVLSEEKRTAMRLALDAARQADQIGDGTTCAARLGEARRLAAGAESGEPKAR
jgi:hypothetical protein